MRIAIGALAGCVWLLSCGGGGGGGGGGGHDDAGVAIDAAVPLAGTLSIASPANDVLIDVGKPALLKLTATLTTADGKRYDVTPDTTFMVDPAYGRFDKDTKNLLTLEVTGRIPVVGTYFSQTAMTEITARMDAYRVVAPLQDSVKALFVPTDREDPALAPQIVYPHRDAVMPRNLGDFELHWTDASHDVFELRLHTEFADVRVYVPGGNGGSSQASWAAFLPEEWRVAVGPVTTVDYGIRGVATSAPAKIGGDGLRRLQVSNEAMEGALYYWANATTETKIGIFRHDMSKPGQPAEEYLTTAKTGDRCIACHVLSRDGTKMAITYQDKRIDGNGLLPPGPATTVDVKTTTIATQTQRWNFATFTPDNKQLLSVDHGVLVVRDADTHALLTTMTTSAPSNWVTHPDLSPDGTQLVYVRVNTTNTDFDFKAGQIFKRAYDAATRTFGPEVAVVNDGKNNFYPSWSPDGAWILFNRNEFGNAYDDSNTSVWAIKADGTVPIELAKANQAVGLTNSWARWAPFSSTVGDPQEPSYWITFSSKRDFGVRLINTGLAQRLKRAQLWMSPFFPSRASKGEDPSAPVFRLPFQSLESSNHIAQWTKQLVVEIP